MMTIIVRLLPRLAASAPATAVAVMLVIPEIAAGAGPERLSSFQMDTVSAGGVTVSAESLATSSGESGYAATRTRTFTKSTPVADIGLAGGTATACCGSDTDATVSTDSSGDGEIIAGGSVNIQNTNPVLSKAIGVEAIVSVSPPN